MCILLVSNILTLIAAQLIDRCTLRCISCSVNLYLVARKIIVL